MARLPILLLLTLHSYWLLLLRTTSITFRGRPFMLWVQYERDAKSPGIPLSDATTFRHTHPPSMPVSRLSAGQFFAETIAAPPLSRWNTPLRPSITRPHTAGRKRNAFGYGKCLCHDTRYSVMSRYSPIRAFCCGFFCQTNDWVA